MHEAKLSKMEAEMKMVFQQKVQEKEAKLKQSEEELYARHREMKDALEKQRVDLDDKKRRIESGRPLTPDRPNVSYAMLQETSLLTSNAADQEEGFPPYLIRLSLDFFSILALFCRVMTLWYSFWLVLVLSPLRNLLQYTSQRRRSRFVLILLNTHPRSLPRIPDIFSPFSITPSSSCWLSIA